MREIILAGRSVAEKNHRMDASRLRPKVRLRHVHRQAVMERDSAARNFDIHRRRVLDFGHLQNFERVLGLEDVHEYSQTDCVRAGDIAHASCGVR